MWTTLVLVLVYLGSHETLAATQCDARYSNPTDGHHTMCLDSSSKLLTSGVSDEDKQGIVDRHNLWRRKVNSTNMIELTWDDEIAAIAQKWSDNCHFAHDNRYNRYNFGKSTVGQNIVYTSRDHGWDYVIDKWGAEENDFVYGGSADDQGSGSVGHYTQIMWAETYKVGCGYTHCQGLPYNFYVCNYSPGGNGAKNRYTPYIEGTACENCPDHCNNGLCDCGGKMCANGGTMDLKTCTCHCQSLHYFDGSDTCELDCAQGTDNRLCGGSVYTKSKCSSYSNLPYTCPEMCGICPSS